MCHCMPAAPPPHTHTHLSPSLCLPLGLPPACHRSRPGRWLHPPPLPPCHRSRHGPSLPPPLSPRATDPDPAGLSPVPQIQTRPVTTLPPSPPVPQIQTRPLTTPVPQIQTRPVTAPPPPTHPLPPCHRSRPGRWPPPLSPRATDPDPARHYPPPLSPVPQIQTRPVTTPPPLPRATDPNITRDYPSPVPQIQTRPVSGARLAAREPGRRPVAFSAEDLLPEVVATQEDVSQADLRLWSEHHVVRRDGWECEG